MAIMPSAGGTPKCQPTSCFRSMLLLQVALAGKPKATTSVLMCFFIKPHPSEFKFAGPA